MEFSKPEYWSGYLFPSPTDLPNPGIEPRSPILQADSLPDEPSEKNKVENTVLFYFFIINLIGDQLFYNIVVVLFIH